MDGREKIKKIMEAEGLNAKQFVDRVRISQGTLSNILNGRNKPSLDVMQSILNAFRTVSSDWLILDSGPMYRPKGSEAVQDTLFDLRPLDKEERPANNPLPATRTAESDELTVPAGIQPQYPAKGRKNTGDTPKTFRTVEKIIVYYSDGTFEER